MGDNAEPTNEPEAEGKAPERQDPGIQQAKIGADAQVKTALMASAASVVVALIGGLITGFVTYSQVGQRADEAVQQGLLVQSGIVELNLWLQLDALDSYRPNKDKDERLKEIASRSVDADAPYFQWKSSDPISGWGRQWSYQVKFSQPFAERPDVVVSLSMLDIGNNFPDDKDNHTTPYQPQANVRVHAWVVRDSVTSEGFTLICMTWGDTTLNAGAVSWQAVGTRP